MAPPLNETFIHRQTTANQVRFTTVPLSEIETKILNAGNHAIELEKRIYQSLTREILKLSDEISGAASGLAELDIATSLARIAQSNDWVRPIVDDSKAFEISGGRHPVVEAALQSDGARFVANDCALNDGKVWLLTGPNMAGKSTFLRQNALIAILAQSGSMFLLIMRISAPLASCSAVLAHPMIWPADGPHLWWRWWKQRQS